MGHSHGHTPTTAGGTHRGRLVVVLGLTLTVLAAEIVGAVLSGSLALLADAGHMATDAAGLALALAAVSLAQRPARGPGRVAMVVSHPYLPARGRPEKVSLTDDTPHRK